MIIDRLSLCSVDCRLPRITYIHKNAQVARGLQTSSYKSFNNLLTNCVCKAGFLGVVTSLVEAVNKLHVTSLMALLDLLQFVTSLIQS